MAQCHLVFVGQVFGPAVGLLAGVLMSLSPQEPGESPAAAQKGCPTFFCPNLGELSGIGPMAREGGLRSSRSASALPSTLQTLTGPAPPKAMFARGAGSRLRSAA